MRTFGLAFLCGASLLACTSDNNTTPGDDELAGEHDDGEQAKADGVDTFGLMTAVKVGKYECNGLGSCTHVDLARAGRTTTKCADDTMKDSCSVRYLDFSAMHMTSGQLSDVSSKLEASANSGTANLIVRGSYVHGTNPVYPGQDWVTFKVSEVWTAQMDDGSISGTSVMITDNGTRCFEPPCAADRETRLNSTRFVDIDGLDWPAPYDKLITSPGYLPNRVSSAISNGTGAIVFGDRTHGQIMHLPSTLRSVEQVFLKLK